MANLRIRKMLQVSVATAKEKTMCSIHNSICSNENEQRSFPLARVELVDCTISGNFEANKVCWGKHYGGANTEREQLWHDIS